MAAKLREKIKLNSTGLNAKGVKTGSYYTTAVNRRLRAEKGTGKLKLKKFDKRAFNEETGKCGMHVEFVEGKIK